MSGDAAMSPVSPFVLVVVINWAYLQRILHHSFLSLLLASLLYYLTLFCFVSPVLTLEIQSRWLRAHVVQVSQMSLAALLPAVHTQLVSHLFLLGT
jgi:hypothetical protein